MSIFHNIYFQYSERLFGFILAYWKGLHAGLKKDNG